MVAELGALPAVIQEQLFTELLDREVQDTLENCDAPLINWNRDLTGTRGTADAHPTHAHFKP